MLFIKMLHHLLLWFCSERLSKLTTPFVTGIWLVEMICGPVGVGVHQSCSLTSIQVAQILFAMK